jgi:uncharacterized protein YbaA (DUF1428 family)
VATEKQTSKTKVIYVRVSDEFHSRFSKAAAAAGNTISEHAWLILNQAIQDAVPVGQVAATLRAVFGDDPRVSAAIEALRPPMIGGGGEQEAGEE